MAAGAPNGRPDRRLIAEADTTRILLIRHAHVDTGPPPGLLCGTFDLPLSASGHAQLAALACAAAGAAPDALYSSTLARAQDTASALASIWGLAPVLDAGLREIHCGRFEGMAIADIQRHHPQLWDGNVRQTDDDFRWPEGESYGQFRQRVVTTLSRLARAHLGGCIAVVSHAGVVAQVIGIVHGRRAAVWEPDRPAPLAMTRVEWGADAPLSLEVVNEAEWWTTGRPPRE